MKVIIAGSRDCADYELVVASIKESGFIITEVVSGCARGVDTLGELWAKDNNIGVKRFPANWEAFGRFAGPVRNKQMAEYADALIVIHNNSRGSLNMLKQAQDKKLKIYEKRY